MNAVKVGMARAARTDAHALMAEIAIILQAHVTVLRDGRYSKFILKLLFMFNNV